MELQRARSSYLEAFTGQMDQARKVLALRQTLWEIYLATGSDGDGDVAAPLPGSRTPDVPELALRAVRELREDYDDLNSTQGG